MAEEQRFMVFYIESNGHGEKIGRMLADAASPIEAVRQVHQLRPNALEIYACLASSYWHKQEQEQWQTHQSAEK